MRTVNFLKAGRFLPNERVFLTTHSRQAARGNTIYHRNRYSTVIRIPVDVFRANFKWFPQSGIYRNDLTYSDLADYMEVIDHGE
jgi:hypothetical protein